MTEFIVPDTAASFNSSTSSVYEPNQSFYVMKFITNDGELKAFPRFRAPEPRSVTELDVSEPPPSITFNGLSDEDIKRGVEFWWYGQVDGTTRWKLEATHHVITIGFPVPDGGWGPSNIGLLRLKGLQPPSPTAYTTTGYAFRPFSSYGDLYLLLP